jgi:hypothetical protein
MTEPMDRAARLAMLGLHERLDDADAEGMAALREAAEADRIAARPAEGSDD